jgi:hypothetical protein
MRRNISLSAFGMQTVKTFPKNSLRLQLLPDTPKRGVWRSWQVLCSVDFLEAEHDEPLDGDEFEILPHVSDREA